MILFAEVINDLQLPLVHPAGDGNQQESEWVKHSLGLQSSLSRARNCAREPSLTSLRRLIRPSGVPPLPRIRSLAYFQPVIAELQQQPLPAGYLDYLRLKFQQAANTLPNDAKKRTFSDDR